MPEVVLNKGSAAEKGQHDLRLRSDTNYDWTNYMEHLKELHKITTFKIRLNLFKVRDKTRQWVKAYGLIPLHYLIILSV